MRYGSAQPVDVLEAPSTWLLGLEVAGEEKGHGCLVVTLDVRTDGRTERIDDDRLCVPELNLFLFLFFGTFFLSLLAAMLLLDSVPRIYLWYPIHCETYIQVISITSIYLSIR